MNLLFVSKSTPNLIKSAGDIRALRMLQILRKEFNIDVVATSADYGTSDVKALGCTPYLHENVLNLLKNKAYDIVIIEHWTNANRYIDQIRNASEAKIIVDSIDLEFFRLQRKLEYDSSKITQAEVDRVRNQELAVYKKADKIIIASNLDKKELLRHGDFDIIDFPCLFDLNDNKAQSGNNAYNIANWIHPPNVDSALYLCEKILPKVDLKFRFVGKHLPASVQKYCDGEKTIMHGCEYEIHKFLPKMNMLLAPILYGAGINGKIGQAMAAGIPVVTTPLGANPYGICHKKHAMVANNEAEFVFCINELLQKSYLRDAIVANGKKLIEEKYTINKYSNLFLEKLRDL